MFHPETAKLMFMTFFEFQHIFISCPLCKRYDKIWFIINQFRSRNHKRYYLELSM